MEGKKGGRGVRMGGHGGKAGDLEAAESQVDLSTACVGAGDGRWEAIGVGCAATAAAAAPLRGGD